MSRSSRRRRGRPYQPLPQAGRNPWGMRIAVLAIGAIVVLGSLALFAAAP